MPPSTVEVVENHPAYRWWLIAIALFVTPLGLGVTIWCSTWSVATPTSITVTRNSVGPSLVHASSSEIEQLSTIRQIDDVSLMDALDNQKDWHDVPAGRFGFMPCYELESNDGPFWMFCESSDESYEIHRISRSEWKIVGFVSEDSARELSKEPSSGDKFDFYNDRWAGAPRGISIPYEHFEIISSARTVNPDGSKDIQVFGASWR